MTDAQLRRRIAAIEAKREALRIEDRFLEQELLIYQARLRLRSEPGGATVNSTMELSSDHKIAISKGRDKNDPFLKAIRAKSYTLRSLAGAVGIPPSLLSMYRTGDRPIPKDRAEQIRKLTGWAADGQHWPGGFS